MVIMLNDATAWADRNGYAHGQQWHNTEGEHLLDALREETGVYVARHGQEAWSATFADGSVIYATGGIWGIAESEADAAAPCGYCDRPVPITEIETVPAASDDAEWERIAQHHAPGCEWVETRSFRDDR